MRVLIFQSAHQTGSGSTDSGGTHETTGKHTTRFPTVRHFSYPSSCRRGDSSRTSIILFACRPRVILQFILIQTQDHLHSTFSQSPSMHTSRLAQCPHECMFYESRPIPSRTRSHRQTNFYQDVASVFLVFIRLQIDSRRTFQSHPAFTF